ncbi:hypothetical protein NPIL_210331 [Nephila pilipes]|uniref:Uncharacterized protein n=1 Tax=Nephila pilipes TaxID=299642 RepID=A0A8X6NKU6_NEPPI|nr:hypothetical protein NPIL_210331 [Nephila pilipes]
MDVQGGRPHSFSLPLPLAHPLSVEKNGSSHSEGISHFSPLFVRANPRGLADVHGTPCLPLMSHWNMIPPLTKGGRVYWTCLSSDPPALSFN